MKNYSHKLTDENLIALLKSDTIGRNQEIRQFMTLLSNMEDDCYSVALNGAWGSGKTFFIKQVKLLLDAKNPYSSMSKELRDSVPMQGNLQKDIPDSYTTVYYDAWINDNHNDPILSLIYASIQSCQSDFVLERTRSLKRIAAALTSALSSHNILSLVQEVEGSDKFQELKSSDDIHDLVSAFIRQLIEEHGNRLVFFIDELDRCKPDYAIRFLERIKHYFNDPRVTFIFAVNLSQLQWTVKNYYGSEFNSTRYLDKFFDLQISLRTIDRGKFFAYQLNITDSNIFGAMGIKCASYFNFSLREMERYGKMLKIASSSIPSYPLGFPSENGMFFVAHYIIPIILALQIYDTNQYDRFVSGKSPNLMVDILEKYREPSDDRPFRCILSRSEKYDSPSQSITEDGKIVCSLSDRLKDVYSIVFDKSRSLDYQEISIGDMSFSNSSRSRIEEITSMLSPKSNYKFN